MTGSKQIHVSIAGSRGSSQGGHPGHGHRRRAGLAAPMGAARGLHRCVLCLPILPAAPACPAPWQSLCPLGGLSTAATISFGSSWARRARARVANSHFLPVLHRSPTMHSCLGCDAQHLPVPPAPGGPPRCPSTPRSPFAGARQGPRCCWRPLGSRFSRLPASRSLEEDLLLSQGVTASREPPNLYLHCNLYLSPAV